MLLSVSAAGNSRYFMIIMGFIVWCRKSSGTNTLFCHFLLFGCFFFPSKWLFSHGCCSTLMFMSVQPSVSSSVRLPHLKGQRGRQNIHLQHRWQETLPAFRDTSACPSVCGASKAESCAFAAAWVQFDLSGYSSCRNDVCQKWKEIFTKCKQDCSCVNTFYFRFFLFYLSAQPRYYWQQLWCLHRV